MYMRQAAERNMVGPKKVSMCGDGKLSPHTGQGVLVGCGSCLIIIGMLVCLLQLQGGFDDINNVLFYVLYGCDVL